MRAQSSISGVMKDVLAEFKRLVAGKTESPVEIWGPKDDPANCSPPSIWWAPGDESWGPGQRFGQAGEPSALWTREIPILLLLFGGDAPTPLAAGEEPNTEEPPSSDLESTDNTEWLLEAIVNAFHRRSSQLSYQIQSGNWGQAAKTEMGQAYELVVLLRLPLVRIDNPTVKLTGLHLQGVNFETRVSNGT
jgi:hypothetical protein